MMRENENLSDMERLEQHDFNLDIEEQRRLEDMVEEEATRVMNKKTQKAINHDDRFLIQSHCR